MQNNIFSLSFLICALLFTLSSMTYSQEANQVEAEKITDHIVMLTNGGGNVGVFFGDDGVLVIDTMMASFTKQLENQLDKIAYNRPIRFVIITHWHYDHVEGNAMLAKKGAVIMAHENVYRRNSTEQYMEFFKAKIPPLPQAALPTITFSQDMTFRMNGEEVYVFSQPAHTDGDCVVYFKKSNVMHLGDLYFAGMYAFYDTSSGGSVNKIIPTLRHLISMMNDSTKIIPGHGPLSNKADLQAYTNMLETMRDRVLAQIKAGKTLEQIIASQPSQDMDAIWGKGFMQPDNFIRLLYSDLSRKQ